MSLSVVADIVAGNDVRCLDGVVQVPSVFIQPVGERATYKACAVCSKTLYDNEKTCSCATHETNIRFHAMLRMQDSTGQLNGVVWDALELLAKISADGDDSEMSPEFFHDRPDRVDVLASNVEVLQFTVLMSFEENKHNDVM